MTLSVQAGGNDLAFNVTPQTIYEQIQSMWDIPLNAGARVLALTVTERGHASPEWKTRWKALNSLVANHTQDDYYVADVAAALPWTEMSAEERKRIWSMRLQLPLPKSLAMSYITSRSFDHARHQ